MDFETLLRKTIGLDAASIGVSTIDRAVRQRMSSTRMASLEDYWHHVQTSKQELQELVESVVVPETWFFRDPEAFACLVRLAHEEWLPSGGRTPFHVLSIPCCTGEEPYSIAMALLDSGFPADMFQVDAVDISERALKRARQGEYGPNSFRGAELEWRDRYFRATGRGYALADALRSQVNFRHGNLLASALNAGGTPYDAIFCRNLLIYFDRETQERIMGILHSLLSPGGFLFVGGSEAYLVSRSGFSAVKHAMAFAFRRAKTGSPESVETPFRAVPRIAPVRPAAVVPVRPIIAESFKLNVAASPVSPVPVRSRADLAAIQRLADNGQLSEAAEQCEGHIREFPPSPDAWYLLGVLREALGDPASALECYRKLLYLNPEHVEGMVHLALMAERQGDSEGAARARERAKRIQARRKTAG